MKSSWPVLQSCKHQKQSYEPTGLSRLPDDLLFTIMSFLTMKEAARTSVVSHRWNHLWRCFPVLVFEDLSAMQRIFDDRFDEYKFQERSNFSNWVNSVVEAHSGRYVDELRVIFDLDETCQSHVDKWLLFAVAKQVKRLELNFTPPSIAEKILLPKWHISLDQPQNLSFFKSCLCSLSLKFVNVTTMDIDCLLRSCMVLENLCIHYSPTLKYIRASGLPLQLKHLELFNCMGLKAIDIMAPKLLSFKHHGKPAELHIRSASMLSKLSFGHPYSGRDTMTYAFDSLSKYLPQLEYMSLVMRLGHGGSDVDDCIQYNLGISNPPAMKNLKHLELVVFALCDQSLLGWADLIEASPQLERLTLIFVNGYGNPDRKIMKRNERPLKSLKTLELHNKLGLPIDLEFLTYVVENSIMLKDVIVEVEPLGYPLSPYVSVQDQVANLRQIVPQGVNFTLKMVEDPLPC